MNEIIQLKITIQGTKPPVWRQIQVEKSITFSQLHTILLIVMGWDGGHLYEFLVDGIRISEPSSDDEGWGGGIHDSSKIKLDSLISDSKTKIVYTYDFGDDWEHKIVLEGYHNKDETQYYPVCIDGKQCCPPEDCGGIYAFSELLKTLKNKNHPDYDDTLEWVGEDYDSEKFDIVKVNKNLRQLNSGKPKAKSKK